MRKTLLHCVTVTLTALWMVCCSGVWRAEAASDTYQTPPYGPLRLVNQQPVQLLGRGRHVAGYLVWIEQKHALIDIGWHWTHSLP